MSSFEAAHWPLPQLPLGCYRLLFTAIQPIALPPFTGSMWRGVFGHALRQLACLTGQDRCDGCALQEQCGYSYLFETKPPAQAEKMRRYREVPHPFVLGVDFEEGGRSLSPGEVFPLHIVLFGRGNDYLPLVVTAFAQAGALGIGRGRGHFRLTGIVQWITNTEAWQSILGQGSTLHPLPPASPTLPACPAEAVTVSLATPVHVKREGRPVGAKDFTFHDFFGNLLRRCSMMTYFHTATPFETDFAALTSAARRVPLLARDLRWQSVDRYSERQQGFMQLNGVLGTLTIPGGELLAPFWPVIWLGQWLHAGKWGVMGMGRYRVVQV